MYGPKYQRMRNEAYYTPPKHVWPLLIHLGDFAPGTQVWDPSAGAGHTAQVLQASATTRGNVMATDLCAPRRQVFPVSSHLDFLKAVRPSGDGPLAIITNPPYGFQNVIAEKFLAHAFELVEPNAGSVAFLLPFEFDAAKRRIAMVYQHPAFCFKLTITTRIRWLNLPQKAAGPMKNHAWYVWDFNLRRRDRMRAGGQLRAV